MCSEFLKILKSIIIKACNALTTVAPTGTVCLTTNFPGFVAPIIAVDLVVAFKGGGDALAVGTSKLISLASRSVLEMQKKLVSQE